MDKRMNLAVALAFVFAMAASAYAEVQNVKVSGDLTASAVARNNFDLAKGAPGNNGNDQESFWGTQVRVKVDADLTDNVQTTIRLINERKWSTETVSSTDIDLDLAYVTLKEFLNPKLSLRIGRQELAYGNKFVLGSSGTASGVFGGLPSDLSIRKAFDAIKLSANLDPVTVDAFFAKIDEGAGRRPVTTLADNYDAGGHHSFVDSTANANGENDDTNLYGVYATHTISDALSMDVYYLLKNNSNGDKTDRIHTLGTLFVAKPIENLKASVEAAYQIGRARIANGTNYDRNAWALQTMLNYTLANVKFTPDFGVCYTYLSGDKRSASGKHAWDSLYYDQVPNNIPYALVPFSNLQAINFTAGMKPVEDWKVTINYGMYYVAHKNNNTFSSSNIDSDGQRYFNNYTLEYKSKLGDAIDVGATYDYTEDVQFGVSAGWFNPGKALPTGCRKDASQVVGTMKVSF